MADFEVKENINLGGNKIKNAGFEAVASLPTANNFVGRQVTYQGRSYIWDGSAWKCDSDTLGGSNKSTFFQNGAVVMNTNPFGGRPLYINSLDNAMYAADKRFSVVATRHLVTYNGETYPKLNPDYVSSYSVTGSGTSFSVSDSPSDIIVYNNDTLCSEVSVPTTQNQYSYSGGILTFGSSVTGTIYVYPKSNVTQYIDSPVVSTQEYSNSIFDGSYESGFGVSSGYYMKIRIMSDVNENPFLNVVDYPYGSLFLSYYYNQTPANAQLRIYNKTYRPHGIGWKKYDFIDFVGNNSGAGYIQSYYSSGDYGRTIMEFIIIAHNAHSTHLTEIDWRLDRPSLSRTGATVTKYSPQTLYYPLTVLDRVISNESINFDTNNIEPTQTGTVTKTSTWTWQYLIQSMNYSWLKLKTWVGGLFSAGSATTNNNYLPKIDDVNKKLVKSNLQDDGTTPKYGANTIWHSGNDGSSSGLDADLLDGKHAGNTNGAIPINNGIKNVNLYSEFANKLKGDDLPYVTLADSWDNTKQAGIDTYRYSAGLSDQPPGTVDNANFLLNIYSHSSGGIGTYGYQLAGNTDIQKLYFRKVQDGSFGSWIEIWHAGNFDPTTKLNTTTINGTQNYLTKYGATGITQSNIFDNGTNVGIGTTTLSEKLHVNGNVKANGYKVGSGTDTKLLTDGGGTKLISDFATSTHTHDYSASNHNHDTTYLGLTATATNSDKLDGKHASEFITPADFETNQLYTPTLNPTWSILKSDNSQSGIVVTTSAITLEYGYKPSATVRAKWTQPSGYGTPERSDGLCGIYAIPNQLAINTDTNPAANIPYSTYFDPVSPIIPSKSVTVWTIYANKKGITVSGNKLIMPVGEVSVNALLSVVYQLPIYYGVVTTNSLDETKIKALPSSMKNCATSSKTFSSNIYATDLQYWVYAYPSAWGDLSNISNADGDWTAAFAKGLINITSSNTLLQTEYRYYITINKGAFKNKIINFS